MKGTDAKQFPLMLKRFHTFLNELTDENCPPPDTTVVFDKGNNSADNFALIDFLELDFVGSVKLDEHKDLAQISNQDSRFIDCETTALEGTKAFRVKKKVYGKERTLIVTYNQNLFDAQWPTLQNDINKALEKLSALRQKLLDRANGIITGGRAPTKASIEKQCQKIISRQHLKLVIKLTVTEGNDGIPRLQYILDGDALSTLADTYLGKNIIITSRKAWDDARIISAYRSQYIIEDIFKEMKDRRTGSWWPLHHGTDSKIQVHGLYCSVAQMLRALALRRVKQAGLSLSMKRFLSELDAVREVINIYPRKRRQKTERRQSVLTKISELQQQLMTVLDLQTEIEKNTILG